MPVIGLVPGLRDAGGAGRRIAARSLFAVMRRRRHHAEQIGQAGRIHDEINNDKGEQR